VTEVALVVTPAPARGAAHGFADGGGRQRGEEQRGQQRDDAQPGRALAEAGQPSATFAMQPERNMS
jgi:flagellar hook-length control protein FliK